MKKIKSFFGITAWLVAMMLLALACNDDLDIKAIGFVYENDEPLHEICEITLENNIQHLIWSDGMGFIFDEYGEFVNDGWWKHDDRTEVLLDFALNSEGRLVAFYQKRTFDVMYNKEVINNFDDDIRDEKFNNSYSYCMEFIKKYNGTDKSYFPNFKGGWVFIFCYETEEDVYCEKIK